MTRRRGPARRVAVAGVVGALYVVLSLIVAPLAYGPLQFRLGEVLKPLVMKYPVTIPAFAVGVGSTSSARWPAGWSSSSCPL